MHASSSSSSSSLSSSSLTVLLLMVLSHSNRSRPNPDTRSPRGGRQFRCTMLSRPSVAPQTAACFPPPIPIIRIS
uniref:Putative secreted protein n=1 Tax=Anopheles marajoara TaxID=58244 RepID=A0A2M4CCW7_9DIPT